MRHMSSRGGLHGTPVESVPYCPPLAKIVPYCPSGGQYGTISSHIALLEGQYGTPVPYCPSGRAIWDDLPALGKKEGGKQFLPAEGQYGTLSAEGGKLFWMIVF